MNTTTKNVTANPAHWILHPSSHPLYSTWKGMIARCHQPNSTSYRWYGAKGVTVCDRWQNSFQAFIADMGMKPTDKHTLDRIDPAGNYEPSNCRWADPATQADNRRKRSVGCVKRTICYNGQSGGSVFWSGKTGIKAQTIVKRIDAGWPLDQALGYAPRISGQSHNGTTTRGYWEGPNGEAKKLQEWANSYGTTVWTLQHRMKVQGMTFEEALVAKPYQKPSRISQPLTSHYLDRNGKPWTPAEIAKIASLQVEKVKRRLSDGWSVEEILTTPMRVYKQRSKK